MGKVKVMVREITRRTRHKTEEVSMKLGIEEKDLFNILSRGRCDEKTAAKIGELYEAMCGDKKGQGNLF